MRSCVLKATKHESPFNVSPLNTLSFDSAKEYCAITNDTDRNCVKAALRPNATVSQIQSTLTNCRTSNPDYAKCIVDFNEYFSIGWGANVSSQDGQRICQLSAEEMRVCMFNSIIKREYVVPSSILSQGSTRFPYDKYFDKCLARWMSNLLDETHLGTQWRCRFNYFYSMDTYDKSWHCALDSQHRLCREFVSSLSSLSAEDLRSHCSRFSRGLTLEKTYGNALWRLCSDRRLLPR